MTDEDYNNLREHVEALECLAADGDEMSIKSLACMALLKEEYA